MNRTSKLRIPKGGEGKEEPKQVIANNNKFYTMVKFY